MERIFYVALHMTNFRRLYLSSRTITTYRVYIPFVIQILLQCVIEMSRIRVVFSIGAMHGGGSERQLVSLLHHLDRSRFEPHLYLVYRSGPLLKEVPNDVRISAFEERNLSRNIYTPGSMHRRRVADFSRYLTESKADVVYDRTFLMTLIAAEAAQRVSTPNVSTIVTDPSRGFAPVAGRFQWLKKRILRRLYSRSSAVIANSNGAARSAETFYGLTPNLVTTVYNGVDIERVRQLADQPVNDEWWNSNPADRRVFRIVTAGRLTQQKGFHLLIDAVGRLRSSSPDVEVRLAILGEGAGRAVLESQIKQANLENSVQLMGFRQEAPAWYKSADLFVLPSFLEGMPNVLLEAMACETCVLSTDCPSGPEEILDNGNCGSLCAVGSVDALVAGITDFLRNKDQHTRFVLAATKRIESEFSIERAARKLEQVLEDVVGENRRV